MTMSTWDNLRVRIKRYLSAFSSSSRMCVGCSVCLSFSLSFPFRFVFRRCILYASIMYSAFIHTLYLILHFPVFRGITLSISSCALCNWRRRRRRRRRRRQRYNIYMRVRCTKCQRSKGLYTYKSSRSIRLKYPSCAGPIVVSFSSHPPGISLRSRRL